MTEEEFEEAVQELELNAREAGLGDDEIISVYETLRQVLVDQHNEDDE